MRPLKKLYTVVEDDSVGAELLRAAAELNYPQLERVFDAIVWRLSREPLCGEKHIDTSGREFRLVLPRSVKGAKNPAILVRYQVEEAQEQVYIDKIIVYPYNPQQAYDSDEFSL